MRIEFLEYTCWTLSDCYLLARSEERDARKLSESSDRRQTSASWEGNRCSAGKVKTLISSVSRVQSVNLIARKIMGFAALHTVKNRDLIHF